jgi:hypothetical protein
MFLRSSTRGNTDVRRLRAVTAQPPPSPPPPPPPPPGPPAGPPPSGPPPFGAGGFPAMPGPTPADRIRLAWQQRAASDYRFDFWTALGWTILTCGIYSFYITYQLVRRSRDHNLRRIEMLDAATTFAWQQAESRGIANELQQNFSRIAVELGLLRQQATQFRDPLAWTLISLISGIVHIILYILIDGDLVTHDRAEGAIEYELSIIYTRLGAAVPAPDPTRMKAKHNYVGRIVATILTCGIYALWWEYNVMTETNTHYEHNWRWEDALAASVQQLGA